MLQVCEGLELQNSVQLKHTHRELFSVEENLSSCLGFFFPLLEDLVAEG
jgi:hypothetical protein